MRICAGLLVAGAATAFAGVPAGRIMRRAGGVVRRHCAVAGTPLQARDR
jgi:hypothetical protein